MRASQKYGQHSRWQALCAHIACEDELTLRGAVLRILFFLWQDAYRSAAYKGADEHVDGHFDGKRTEAMLVVLTLQAVHSHIARKSGDEYVDGHFDGKRTDAMLVVLSLQAVHSHIACKGGDEHEGRQHHSKCCCGRKSHDATVESNSRHAGA